MKRLILSIAILISFNAHADTLKFCSTTAATSTSVPSVNGYNTSLTSSSTIVAGQCQAPPPPGGTCTDGTPSDIPNYTAICSGNLMQHKGGSEVNLGSGPYSFNRVFGGPWAGAYFGYVEYITVPIGRYVSIPFQPSPGHTIALGFVDTFSPNSKNTFSVSTTPGLFNGGVTNGTTVVCAGTFYPNLVITSNNTQTNCPHLDPTKTYWFNMVAGVYAPGNGFVGCSKAPCKVAVQESSIN